MGRREKSIKLEIPLSFGSKNKGFWDQIKKNIVPVVDNIYDQAEAEAKTKSVSVMKSIYKEIIRQYYTYKTVWYNRHGEGVGTRTGFNLYRAYEAKYVDNPSDDAAMLQSGYLPSRLLQYRQISKRQPPPSKQQVFAYIMKGGRSLPPWATRNGVSGGMQFIADINSQELGTMYGAPINVMDEAAKRLPNYFDKVVFDYFKTQLNRIKLIWR